MPSAPLCENSPRWPGGQLGRQRGVEPDVLVVVDDAEGVGPDDAHPGAARSMQQPVLQLLAHRAGLGEAGETTSRVFTPPSAQSVTTSSTCAAGTATSEVPGMSVTRAWEVSPQTSMASLLTA